MSVPGGSERIELATPDGPMEVLEVVPDGTPRAAVIVVQEAFGLNHHIADVTQRVADEGYHAVAPAFFHRSGGGTVGYDEYEKILPLFAGLDDDGVLRDIDATLAHLRSAGWSDRQVGIVGFCWGGRVTFLAAVRRAIGAGVGFYGGGIASSHRLGFPALIDEVSDVQAPWLGLFGDEDQSIPVEDVERLRACLADAPVPTEVVRYADAGHGFHCDARDAYRPGPAADAWRRTLDWFSRHLPG